MTDTVITSRSNESIKQIKKLRDRKYREITGSAYVEGIRQVVEAIEQKIGIEKLVFVDSFFREHADNKVVASIRQCEAPRMIVSEEVFRSFSVKEGPQGVAAIVKQTWITLDEIKHDFAGVWVCLWEVADPGNLGTIIRTVDAVGAKGVILAGNCTDPYDPVSIRASMGGVFSVSLVKSTLDKLIEFFQEVGTGVYGTSDAAANEYRSVSYPNNMILVMGSERQGIPGELEMCCSEMVSLPMRGVCDSLNLAVATGVMLYEILAQHSKIGSK